MWGFCQVGLTAFSPHAWGWSAVISKAIKAIGVLPTRVGMVRDCKLDVAWF